MLANVSGYHCEPWVCISPEERNRQSTPRYHKTLALVSPLTDAILWETMSLGVY